MKKINTLWHLALTTTLLFCLVGCEIDNEGVGENNNGTNTPQYGYYYFGDQEIPVASCVTAEGPQFLLKISPLEEVLTATTYAVIGVHTELLGKEVDVELRFHNDDYIFIYEDPVCYYSHYRPLKSGTIILKRNGTESVDVEVDVLLFDGTPFRYSATGLRATSN